MLYKQSDKIIVVDDFNKWVAEHPANGINGPLKISYKKDTLLRDCSGYCGDHSEESAVVKKIKDYHKGGNSFIEAAGAIPFPNGKVKYLHSYKYSNKRVRVTSDINFEGQVPINRHFGLGSLFLPGKWDSIYIVPAAKLMTQGAQEKLVKVPKYNNKPLMLGHWHRAPLSVTFKRPNGASIEIGTGSDLWRWDENLGYGPESGSFKIILEEKGLHFIREALACCEEFTPANKPFRLSWYMAWRENGANKSLPEHHEIPLHFSPGGELDTATLIKQLATKNLYSYALFDFQALTWQDKQLSSESPFDYVRNIKTDKACWASGSVATRVKKIVRKLINIEALDGIIFANFAPRICFQSHHLNKKHPNGTVHWDINALFDFASWAKNISKDKVDLFWQDKETPQPSLLGLFE